MDLFEELEAEVRDNGVRVEERLALLQELRDDAGFARLRDRLEAGEERLEAAARALRREARGR